MVDYQAAIKMTFQNIFKDLKKYLLYNIELGWGLKEKKKHIQGLAHGTQAKKNFVVLINIYNKIASLYFKYIYTYINM